MPNELSTLTVSLVRTTRFSSGTGCLSLHLCSDYPHFVAVICITSCFAARTGCKLDVATRAGGGGSGETRRDGVIPMGCVDSGRRRTALRPVSLATSSLLRKQLSLLSRAALSTRSLLFHLCSSLGRSVHGARRKCGIHAPSIAQRSSKLYNGKRIMTIVI